MPFNRMQFMQLCLLLFAVPAQYMLTEWWGKTESGRTTSLYFLLSSFKDFRTSYLSLSSWKSAVSYILKGTIFSFRRKAKVKTAPQGECLAKEVFQYNSRYGYFSNSIIAREPRPKHLKYRVGQVMKHKIHGYRGVIVGWDKTCRAPTEWMDVMHGANYAIRKQPHYLVLVDKRDRTEIQSTYVAEENVITLTNVKVRHPSVWDYFDFYDGAQYHMRPAMQELYPED